MESLLCIGIDEAGRGCLAGPVVAAAVLLPSDFQAKSLPGRLTDSKKLSEKQRMILRPLLMDQALAFGVGYAWAKEIDRINILQATLLAMSRATASLYYHGALGGCEQSYLENLPLYIDGTQIIPVSSWKNVFRRATLPKQVPIIGGDVKNLAISAASILAKTTRDILMCRFAKKYPGYGFEEHKGYGTKRHVDALATLGPTPLHRMTFRKVRKEKEVQGMLFA